MLVWFWLLAISARALSETDVHLILESDLRLVKFHDGTIVNLICRNFRLETFGSKYSIFSDQEVQWSIDYIEKSFTDGSKFNIHVRKLKHPRVNLSNCK